MNFTKGDTIKQRGHIVSLNGTDTKCKEDHDEYDVDKDDDEDIDVDADADVNGDANGDDDLDIDCEGDYEAKFLKMRGMSTCAYVKSQKVRKTWLFEGDSVNFFLFVYLLCIISLF